MIKPRLRSKQGVPYGGVFDLNLPEKGMVGRSYNFEGLLGKIAEYRHANGIPMGVGFVEEVEQEVCLRYPQESIETDARVPDTTMRLTWEDIIAGTRHLTSFVAAGRPLVDRAEAERRAAICSTCPFKGDFVKQCGQLCGALLEMVNSVTGGQKTNYDSRLQSCRVCKCHCQAIIWVPLEFQTAHLTDLQRQQYQLARDLHGCWKAQ